MTGPSAGAGRVDADDHTIAFQLGRRPRGRWSVAARCRWGRPTVIAMAPLLETGARFPTALWLTCPWLARGVDDLESAGATGRWTLRVASEPELAERVLAADEDYRRLRASLGGGVDPCAGVGTAGQSDPLAVKCVHARVAAALAGIADPIGEGALAELHASGVSRACPEDRCVSAESTRRAGPRSGGFG